MRAQRTGRVAVEHRPRLVELRREELDGRVDVAARLLQGLPRVLRCLGLPGHSSYLAFERLANFEGL